jgi:hypothetical protein
VLLTEPTAHHEQRAVIGEKDVSLLQQHVRLDVEAIGELRRLPLVRPPGRDDEVLGLSEAIDVLSGGQVFARIGDFGDIGELARGRSGSSAVPMSLAQRIAELALTAGQLEAVLLERCPACAGAPKLLSPDDERRDLLA